MWLEVRRKSVITSSIHGIRRDGRLQVIDVVLPGAVSCRFSDADFKMLEIAIFGLSGRSRMR
jgi:hypothetical protein